MAIGRSRVVWRVTGADAEDGTGDFVVPLPTELSELLGWQIGDELSIERIEPGMLRLRRI
ncbi:AbrB/MazE/SpoVT family DNA-binding domain-containing protein [Ralstonia pickettii]|nr:AbrB/MazE/SpoVT family DNA-binding domain-containing protein [Ralstonia pickettii]